MRFYRLERIADGSLGSEWFTDKAEAQRANRKWITADENNGSNLTVHEIEPTKAGILKALNSVASHPDNG